MTRLKEKSTGRLHGSDNSLHRIAASQLVYALLLMLPACASNAGHVGSPQAPPSPHDEVVTQEPGNARTPSDQPDAKPDEIVAPPPGYGNKIVQRRRRSPR